MSEDDTDYYLIEGGTALAHFKVWEAKHIEAQKRRIAFFEKVGTSRYLSGGRSVLGLVWVDPKTEAQINPPSTFQWTWNRRYSAWQPSRKTPEGKALYIEMRKLDFPDVAELTHELLGVGVIFFGMKVFTPGIETLKGKPIIKFPAPTDGDGRGPQKAGDLKGKQPKPLVDGIRKMTRSEYWALKEGPVAKTTKTKAKRTTKAKRVAPAKAKRTVKKAKRTVKVATA